MYEQKYEIPLYPIIGSASLPFRGGLSPETVDSFLNEYRGVRTALLQSAFRYDYPKKEVIRAIQRLESLLPRARAEKVLPIEQNKLLKIMKIFEGFYKITIEGIAGIINEVADNLPKRRERVQHVGLFGYSRGIGKVRLPRAIGFTGALYSIGIPPELIGTGRGLRELKVKNKQSLPIGEKLKVLEKYYLNLRQDLIKAGAFLNKRNLKTLVLKNKYFKDIEEDVAQIEKYLGRKLEPQTQDELEHQKLTSKILQNLSAKKPIKDLRSLTALIEKSALLRKSLG